MGGATAMISRTEKNMQVRPEALEPRETPKRAKDAAAELEALRARVAAAATLMPALHEVHCRDCFEKGRDAVLRAIEGTTE
jgi:hypothetical protein